MMMKLVLLVSAIGVAIAGLKSYLDYRRSRKYNRELSKALDKLQKEDIEREKERLVHELDKAYAEALVRASKDGDLVDFLAKRPTRKRKS